MHGFHGHLWCAIPKHAWPFPFSLLFPTYNKDESIRNIVSDLKLATSLLESIPSTNPVFARGEAEPNHQLLSF
ncbi:hypothetical protein PVL29_020607 [Vitis rotundifolia]|uniref:Uncharacterized protein n=1 Tax=Vitis rotundifolia TaxID=103349 RepID=A0AA38YXF2_VITRO|nr:hypothetical protein PVL29_020607 [Vitis rotundifolia]